MKTLATTFFIEAIKHSSRVLRKEAVFAVPGPFKPGIFLPILGGIIYQWLQLGGTRSLEEEKTFQMYRDISFIRPAKWVEEDFRYTLTKKTKPFSLLVGISSGSEQRQSTVPHITIRSIRISIHTRSNLLSSLRTVSDTHRILLFYDRFPIDGKTASLKDLFTDQQNPTFSQRNLKFRDRFKVLWDTNLVPINNEAGNSNVNQLHTFYTKACLNSILDFSHPNPTQTRIISGDLGLIHVVSSNKHDAYTTSIQFRIGFTDGQLHKYFVEYTEGTQITRKII